ncbi:hypothetical protein [Pseudoflavonifractor hominis]|uniref:Biotin transporter n=1 Tax=Pseudoflavonifractor hominis TaxID=2763059 RepID=A0ABR7HUG7_9FIRM|nr:hypothetical protein [Pseudoflavonifractor hominis]
MPRARSGGAREVALPAVLAALSLLLLYGASIAPSGRMGLVALSGLVTAAAVVSGGLHAGLLCYGAAGILGLLLVPDKGSALLYLLFFGVYPVIKSRAERLRTRLAEYGLKLLCFNLALTILWFGFRGLFLPFLPEALRMTALVYLVGNPVFLVYDFGCSKAISLYVARLGRRLGK